MFQERLRQNPVLYLFSLNRKTSAQQHPQAPKHRLKEALPDFRVLFSTGPCIESNSFLLSTFKILGCPVHLVSPRSIPTWLHATVYIPRSIFDLLSKFPSFQLSRSREPTTGLFARHSNCQFAGGKSPPPKKYANTYIYINVFIYIYIYLQVLGHDPPGPLHLLLRRGLPASGAWVLWMVLHGLYVYVDM